MPAGFSIEQSLSHLDLILDFSLVISLAIFHGGFRDLSHFNGVDFINPLIVRIAVLRCLFTFFVWTLLSQTGLSTILSCGIHK